MEDMNYLSKVLNNNFIFKANFSRTFTAVKVNLGA